MSKGLIREPATGKVAGYGSEALCIQEIPRAVCIGLIRAHHYSHTHVNNATAHLGVMVGGRLKGALQLGYAMNPASCGSVVEGTERDQYLELNRMWIDDELGRNSESMVLSYVMRYLKHARPRVKWIQSFADERCGRLGVVYQAANFTYHGEHEGAFYLLDGAWYHQIHMNVRKELGPKARYLQANKDRAETHVFRQFRYIYWLDQRWKSRCLYPEQPYPKPDAAGLVKPEPELLEAA